MKTCTNCKQDKPLSEYVKDSWSADGLEHRCKDCMHEYLSNKNPERMWVNGKYISKKHPLYKAGRYKTLSDAWSHIEIDTRTTDGSVYIIHNKSWPNWYKVGKAASAEDRLNGYQTSSPFRDYELLYSVEFDNRHRAESDVHKLLRNVLSEDNCKGEWFKADLDVIKEMIDVTKSVEAQLDMFDETG